MSNGTGAGPNQHRSSRVERWAQKHPKKLWLVAILPVGIVIFGISAALLNGRLKPAAGLLAVSAERSACRWQRWGASFCSAFCSISIAIHTGGLEFGKAWPVFFVVFAVVMLSARVVSALRTDKELLGSPSVRVTEPVEFLLSLLGEPIPYWIRHYTRFNTHTDPGEWAVDHVFVCRYRLRCDLSFQRSLRTQQPPGGLM